MKKVCWADLTDDDPIPPYEVDPPVVISKHGIKIKKDAQPHLQDKTAPPVKDKSWRVKSVAKPSTDPHTQK